MKSIYLLVLIFFTQSWTVIAQKQHQWNSNEIFEHLEKMQVLCNVLYIAAHPDDENTRLISWLSNDVKANTAYLSLTRGDGGQNLIGTEIGPKLGLIRTNELLGARNIDGGSQFFTRAIDFGYSKHSDETLSIWNKEEVLKDIVKVIRQFRPDILINRFDHRTPGETHGHHTSSAILALEAFKLAADPSYIIDEDESLQPWTVTRHFFNTGWWFYGSRENFDSADKSKLVTVDVGTYLPLKGLSNSEIAAQSRTMHKSQGFGSTGTRGSELEYLEFLQGSDPGASNELFYGMDTDWSRLSNGTVIKEKLSEILSTFNFADPSVHIDQLLELNELIKNCEDPYWADQKGKELKEIIAQCLGLYLEARTNQSFGNPASTISITNELTNRSTIPVSFVSVRVNGETQDLGQMELASNVSNTMPLSYSIGKNAELSSPYWLRDKESLGLYNVQDKSLIGKPVGDASVTLEYDINVKGTMLSYERELIYKYNDPVKGEAVEPFYILPELSISFDNPVYIFSDRGEKEISLNIESFKKGLSGVLSLTTSGNWQIRPKVVNIDLAEIGEKQKVSFYVKGPLMSESSLIRANFLNSEGETSAYFVDKISYDHIPLQRIIYPAEAQLERIAIEKSGNKLAYIPGAGDEVSKALSELKYELDILEPGSINSTDLSQYDAIVFGIRAFNVHPDLVLSRSKILDYISQGGNVLVQYNTNRGLDGNLIGPYPLRLSRNRVTDENAVVEFLLPDHEVLNRPNRITSKDFEGWVQERGLYFPDEWSDKYEAPISCSDPGEDPMAGSLLIARYGKGNFIYSGISWFRQLPAGIPGAYRLFANILSLGKSGDLPSSMNVNSPNNGRK